MIITGGFNVYSVEVEQALEHDRDHHERLGLVHRHVLERGPGSELAAQYQGRGHRQRNEKVGEAPGVEHRRRVDRDEVGSKGDLREQRPDRVEARHRTVRALRRTRGTGGEDRGAPLLGRGHHVGSVADRDQVVEGRLGKVVLDIASPGDETLITTAGIADERRELIVVDQRGGLLARNDLGDLWAREARVEVQHVGAELRARHRRLDEATMIAAQEGHVVALAQSLIRERVRERVGSLVELPVGELPSLVDEGELGRVADR